MYVKIATCRDGAIIPQRANPSDGLDFFVPLCAEPKTLKPGENYPIPTGIKMEVPHGFGLFVKNKSGVAAKRCLVKGAELIDHGYKGEIFIDMHNIGTEDQVIKPGEKISQAVLLQMFVPSVQVVGEDELYLDTFLSSGRGEGSQGSTGTKI